MASQTKKVVCVWCKGECGLIAGVEDGCLKSLTPDPAWPRKVYPPPDSCPRMLAGADYFYHPARLNYPLKRIGERGSGRWQEITWNQALDEVASLTGKLIDKHGPETIAWARGTGYRTDPYVLARFFRTIGTPNNCTQGQICYLPRAKMADALAGYFPHYSVREETRCIVALGAEPMLARPITAYQIRLARSKGAKIIVIDPRKTHLAETADMWLQLRPGTDAALLLGMINVIIGEGLYDPEFVDKWCQGFDELRQRAGCYDLETVSGITGVRPDLIISAARLYADRRPGCFIEGMGIEQNYDVAPALQARWALAGLTANIDVAGGEEQVGPHPAILTDPDLEPRVKFPPGVLEKQIGAGRFRFLTRKTLELLNPNAVRVWGKNFAPHAAAHAPSVYRAMITGDPYPVQGLYCVAANPMVTQANTKLVYQALKSLDLVVVSDLFMTPTADLADYVLPVASWLETPILWDYSGHSNYMVAGEAALPPARSGYYDRKTDYDIFRELALMMGKGGLWPWPSLERYYDELLKPTGLTHHEFVYQRRCELKEMGYKKYEKNGFATPSGKVELYSSILENLGYDPLPGYVEPAETPLSSPELLKDFPLKLINGGRVRPFFHSEWRQVAAVRGLHPDPLVQIHPETAAGLDIRDGDWVWIETARGRIRQKASLTGMVSRDMVHAEHGWWYPEVSGSEPSLHGVWESNVNVLLNEEPDVCSPVTGGWPLKTALCRVYKEP